MKESSSARLRAPTKAHAKEHDGYWSKSDFQLSLRMRRPKSETTQPMSKQHERPCSSRTCAQPQPHELIEPPNRRN
jgi:hypothetical protein